MTMILPLTQDVLRHYPQIYLACHLQHVRPRSNAAGLTDKDVVLLGHLDRRAPVLAGPLARHLGIGAPALSAQLQRLETRGLVKRRPRPRDRRHIELRLTPAGAAAMATTSVLDPGRVTALLAQLTPRRRAAAVRGLALLAEAARALQLRHPNRSHRSP